MKKTIFILILLACATLYAARNRAMQNKPVAGTPINTMHAWAQGLSAAYIFAEQSGTGTYDSLHGTRIGTYGTNGAGPGPNWVFASRQWAASTFPSGTGQASPDAQGNQGVGGQVSALRIYGNFNDRFQGSDQYLPGGTLPVSFLMHVVTGATPDGGANRIGCIFLYGTTGTNNEARGIRLLSNTSVSWVSWGTDMSGTVPAMKSTESLWIGGMYDGTTANLFYGVAPGRLTNIASAARSYSIVKTGTLSLGISTWSSEFFDGWIDYLYFWSVPVPLDKMNAITLDPFDMFVTTGPTWQRYNLAKFGGGTMPPAVF